MTLQNAPLTITLRLEPEAPQAGDVVRVHVEAFDPDAAVTDNCGTVFFDDVVHTEPQIGFACAITRPPLVQTDPAPGRYEGVFTHRFLQPGAYRFIVGLNSGGIEQSAAAPYGNRAQAELVIVVAELAPVGVSQAETSPPR